MHLVRKPLSEGPFSLDLRGFRGRLLAAVRRRGSHARGWPRLRFRLVQHVSMVSLLLAMARLPQWARGGRDHVSARVGIGRGASPEEDPTSGTRGPDPGRGGRRRRVDPLIGWNEKRELRASRMTGWSSN